MQNERKYPQNERKYPQTSANLKSVTIPPSSGWKKGMWSSVFSGGERFLGGRAEIGNSSVFFSYLKKRARWVPQELRKETNRWLRGLWITCNSLRKLATGLTHCAGKKVERK